MKTGTNVGLDKDFLNIAVGDQVKDKDGTIYKIDQYGRAVRNADGKPFDLSAIQPCELWSTPDTRGTNLRGIDDDDLLAEVKRRGLKYTESPEIAECSDADLAAELRARGYEVKATKTTIIEL